MATIDGATALGVADRTGSIEVGKRADLVVLDARSPSLTPSYDPVSTVAYAARGPTCGGSSPAGGRRGRPRSCARSTWTRRSTRSATWSPGSPPPAGARDRERRRGPAGGPRRLPADGRRRAGDRLGRQRQRPRRRRAVRRLGGRRRLQRAGAGRPSRRRRRRRLVGGSAPRRPASWRCTSGSCGRCPTVGAVVHTHSRYAAAFAVARLDLPFICNESIATRAEQVLVTEYAPPGSTDLGEQALRTFARQPGQPGRAAGQPRRRGGRADARRGRGRGPVRRVDGRDLPPRPHAARRRHRRARPRPRRAGRDRAQLRRRTSPSTRPMNAARGHRAPRPRAAARRGWVLPPDLAVTAGRRAPDGTAIVAMLTDAPDGFSQFHRLGGDELWHFYAGDADRARAARGGRGEPPRRARLGPRRGPATRARGPGGHVDGRPHDGRAGACSATRWRPGSRRRPTRAPTSTSCVAGWPAERDAIDALTRPGAPRRMPDGL